MTQKDLDDDNYEVESIKIDSRQGSSKEEGDSEFNSNYQDSNSVSASDLSESNEDKEDSQEDSEEDSDEDTTIKSDGSLFQLIKSGKDFITLNVMI